MTLCVAHVFSASLNFRTFGSDNMFTSNKTFIKLNLPFVVNTAFYKIMIVDLTVGAFLYVLYINPVGVFLRVCLLLVFQSSAASSNLLVVNL